MLKRNQRQYLGILFEVWDSNQSWFWFVIDPHCEGGSIGAAASETEAVRDACRSIDEMMMAYLPPSALGWEISLANLERYLACGCDYRV
jgi:hypothetical protein